MGEERTRGRGQDGDISERAEGVRTVCCAGALHLAEAEEVDWKGWGEVGGVVVGRQWRYPR